MTTMTMVPQEINMVATSNPTRGATNISSDGSRFDMNLETPIEIPRNAVNVTVQCDESTIWWTVPNIITGVNDTFYITGDDASSVLTNYTITIPQGLYDRAGLNTALQSGLEAAGAKTTPDPIVSLLDDESTQKVVIRLNYTTSLVDFQVARTDTCRDILGFDPQQVGPNAGAPINILADNVAAFNSINNFEIHSDLVGQGIRVNNTYTQTIAEVNITVNPGSQIVDKPFHPAKSDASALAGVKRGTVRFWLTDDSNNAVDTNSEYWTTRLTIQYLVPMKI
jgi:hypothetical protein